MPKSRRDFLSDVTMGAGLLLAGCGRRDQEGAAADVTLRIAPVLVDIAKDHTISTIGYNGSGAGAADSPAGRRARDRRPIQRNRYARIRALARASDSGRRGRRRGGKEPGRSGPRHLRYRLTPQPSGARFVHTHVMPMSDLSRGTYTGQFAFVYIEPKNNPGQYDQEIFLATHEWEPFFTTEEMDEEEPGETHEKPPAKNGEKPNGWEIGYQRFTINGKCLGYGEPVRVKEGQRVLFHFLNASATENIKLALPGHQFQVVALDGNPVPHPQLVDVLELGTAERIDAVVEMKNPGVWILGTPKDDDRKNGMGIVVEYARQDRRPAWIKPPKTPWDYTIFGENRAGSQRRRNDPAGVRQDQRRHRRLQSLDHQRQSFRRKTSPALSIRASAIG